MKGIKIRKLKNIGNYKGIVFNTMTKNVVEIPVFYRKKGVIFGNHYHTGKDPSKNPESIIFLEGKINFFAKDLETGEEHETTIEEGTELTIYPNIVHASTALEDTIFIEPRSTIYNKENSDTIEYILINKDGTRSEK